MNKLSFFKGALIACVLSIVFWVGAAVVIIYLENTEATQEQEQMEIEELEENMYAFL